MAAALLGKCIGFLAIILLLYSCYAFKIREHGVQTVSSSAELPYRATCASNFGRCTERTTTTSRKWHETPTQRLASIRKPPAEVTLSDDDDTDTEPARRKLQRTDRSTDKVADDDAGTGSDADSIEVEGDDDEEDAVVEVEEDTAEITIDTDEDKGESDEDDDERRDRRKKEHRTEKKSIEQEDESKTEEDEGASTSKKDETREKYTKIFRGTRKSVEKGDEGDEDEKKKSTSIEKSLKHKSSKKADEGKTDELVKDDDDKESTKEDNGEDDDDEEDDEDEEEESEEVPTPPPRKLEKVRHADKDKVRSAEIPPVMEKPKVEVKTPTEPTKKQEEAAKKVDESAKKQIVSTKEPAESLEKPVESTKKVESAKVTKPESGPSKPKATPKPEQRTKSSSKPEVSRESSVKKEKPKQSDKATAKTVNVQSVPAKPAEVKRSDKDESKSKTKTHVDAPFTLAQLNDAILSVPTFVPNFTAVEDFECQQHGKIFLRQLRGYKLWALQMLDANGKIPSGLLRGNSNQFGDFDECLGVLAHVKLNDSTIKVQGKYCLANIDLHPSHPDVKFPVNLMQGRAFIRSTLRDPSHFISTFTTVKWALCLPAACTAEDAQHVLEQALNDYNSTAGIKFTVNVDPNMCYVKQKSRTYSKETIGVLYFYAMVVCLVTVATVRDYFVVSEGKGNYSERIIMAFSLRRTVKTLLKEGPSKSEISCIHGIRTISTILIYMAHMFSTRLMLPYTNRNEFTEIANLPVSAFIRVGAIYTDVFLLLSGLLTAYNMAFEYTRRGEIRWFCRFIARYIRLTPILLAVVFWYAFVMEHTGTGPQWNSLIRPNAELCKNNAWTNLLYIQNFFPFEEMCAPHTHHLASDMQLSLLAPMLVFFLECKPMIGILLIIFFILLSATLRYIAVMNNYLSLVIYHGISIRQLFKTADLTYTIAIHRATPYVMGVGLGVLLYHTGRNVKIHKVLVILGWLIAMALGAWSLFSPWHLARRDYVYDVEEATNYAVFYPVVWSLALCWFIFVCHTNNADKINRFLSNYWLILVSRISYAIYLTQFAVFFYNVAITRYPTTFDLLRSIDLSELAIVLAISTVLTLFFDFPMQEVKNVLMESTDVLNTGVSNEKKPTGNEAQKLVKEEQRQEKVFDEDEVSSTGWDWQKDIVGGGKKSKNEVVEDEEQVTMPILKSSSGRRRSFIAYASMNDEPIPSWDRMKESSKRLSADEDEYRDSGRRSRNGQRDYEDSENEELELLRMQREREEAVKRSRRSLSRSFDGKGLSTRGSEDEEEYLRRREEEEEDPRRYRRSESRGRSVIRESDDYRSWEFVGKDRSSSRGPDSKRLSGKSEEHEPVQRQTRPLLSRSGDVRRVFSSESEDEHSQRKRVEKSHPSAEPRISDEEDWESELRIRRKQFMEKLATQQQQTLEEEVDLNSLKRRSSAEGKIALLKDPSTDDNMDSWTVSVGPRFAQLGSSQERSEAEEDNAYTRRREYRERAPPPREDTQSEEDVIWDASRRRSNNTSGSQITSVEEDEDVSTFNFVLTKDSKRKSMQDLSKMSQDDSDAADSSWNIVNRDSMEALPRSTSTGLYKRESIIKSQASEEDPEYLLPERPKLVQQEREHPFKKAWQMQKSRSEEDGSAYIIKELKEHSKMETRPRDEDLAPVRREPSGEQYEDMGSFADDESDLITLSQSRSTDTEDTTTRSKSEESESLSTELSKSTSIEDNKAHSKSDVEEDTLQLNWPTEDERCELHKTTLRSKSEETDWGWEQEET